MGQREDEGPLSRHPPAGVSIIKGQPAETTLSTKISSAQRARTVQKTVQPSATPTGEKRLGSHEIARRTGLARLDPGLATRMKRPLQAASRNRLKLPGFTKGILSGNGSTPPTTLPPSSTSTDSSDGARGGFGGIFDRIRDAVDAARVGADDFRKASTEERKELLKQARGSFNESDDPHAMDSVDLFRDSLDPAVRFQYDQQLAKLRDDPRVRVVDPEGNPADPATREQVLRGMLAATFPDKAMLDNAIQTAVDTKFEDGQIRPDGEGTFDVIVYPDSFNIGDHTYPGYDGQAPGLKTQDGDVVISESFLDHTVAAGEHLMIHEFSHCLQSASDDGGVAQSRPYPEDFPFGAEVDAAFDGDPALRDYIESRFGTVHGGQERFPTLMNVFHTEPEALRAASPELYDMMVRYTGLDPIAGETIPEDQIDRVGSGDEGGGFWSWINPFD